MASDNRLLAAVHRLGHGVQEEPARAADRGPADAADGVWPVGASFSLAGATGWLNSPALTGSDLRGRVVLINFWTFTCINWLRQLPYVRAWEQAYRAHGLVVVGVHSPEFSFERDADSVRRAVQAGALGFPIALDDRFAVWRSFDNHYWPALYLVDAGGRLRHHSFGEGGYEETEAVLRQLLAEGGAGDLGPEPQPVEVRGIEAPADWATLRSPETYLGADRTSGFASSPRLVRGRPQDYATPAHLRTGHWALDGRWLVESEFSASQELGGRLSCRFSARDVHLVAGPGGGGSEVRFRVRLDGRAPGADHGEDTDPSGAGRLAEPRLHQLVRQRGPVEDRTVEIEFLDPGAQVYSFTFG